MQHLDRIVPADRMIPVPALPPEDLPKPLGFARRWASRAAWPVVVTLGLLLALVGVLAHLRFLVISAIVFVGMFWYTSAKERRKASP